MGYDRQDIHRAGIPVLCRSCEARHRGMCCVPSADELTALARHTHKASHASGDELIGASTETTSYAKVMRGVVKFGKGLEDARDWMATLGRKSAAEKVASFLLLIALHADPERDDGPIRFELPLTRSDIADFLGPAIETVSRQLTRLKADG